MRFSMSRVGIGQRPARARAGGAAMVPPRQRACGACGRHDRVGPGVPSRRAAGTIGDPAAARRREPTARSPDAPALTHRSTPPPAARSSATRSCAADSVTALCHENPDADTIGGAVAMALIARKLGKRAQVVSTDRPGPSYDFMPEMRSVSTVPSGDAGPGGDLRRGDARARRARGRRARVVAGRGAHRQRRSPRHEHPLRRAEPGRSRPLRRPARSSRRCSRTSAWSSTPSWPPPC